jgi:alkylation response protein AidB-like acyl-CoA dehydrogenase
MIAAASVGVCDHALELAQNHLTKRVLYGKPLIAKSTIRDQLAELHTKVEASWLLACQAAATWDSGDFAVQEASMAKLFAADTAVQVVNEAMELLGGHGYTADHIMERMYRDVKAFEIVEGASLVQKAIIAKEVLAPKIESSENEATAIESKNAAAPKTSRLKAA